MAIRQRRGHNRWTEPQEFAASGVGVDVTNGKLRVGSFGLEDLGSLFAIRNNDFTNYGTFKCKKFYAVSDIIAQGGTIKTTNSRTLQLLPDAGGITKVGNAATTSHGLNTNDDLFVTGDEEVVGDVFMDNLPTSDPSVAGQLYADSADGYTVKQSQG